MTVTPTRFWSRRGVAAYTGRSYNEINRILREGRLPRPDIKVGGPTTTSGKAVREQDVWLPKTIINWWKRYVPQQHGVRNDLFAPKIDDHATEETPTPRLLSLPGVAIYTGLSYHTIKARYYRGVFARPDIELGGPIELDHQPDATPISHAYDTDTIDAWYAEFKDELTR